MPTVPVGALALAVTALGLGAIGCTEYEPASDTLPPMVGNPLQPGSQMQGAQMMTGAEPGSDWSCLSVPAAPAPAPGALGAAVVYSLRLVDLATGEPFTSSTVRVCGLTDITCDSPVMEQMTPDADGWVNVPLSSNFSGYLEIVSEEAPPYLFHLPDAGIRTMRDFPLVMIGLESFAALLSALRIQFDPTLGAFGMRVFDCQGTPAPNVAFRTNSGGTPYYFEAGLPNTARNETDSGGLGGYIGSLPGVTVIESELSNGTVTSTKSVIIRPGWMTTGFMRPAQAVVR